MSEEKVNHPKHYNQYPIEVIDMMVAIWGKVKNCIEIKSGELLQYWIECPKDNDRIIIHPNMFGYTRIG